MDIKEHFIIYYDSDIDKNEAIIQFYDYAYNYII